jgi:hypothetical protein
VDQLQLHNQDKFIIRPFVGGVSCISGESSVSDMAPLLHRINRLSMRQDYIVLPEQRWLDGISTTPSIIKQFMATETAPPRNNKESSSKTFGSRRFRPSRPLSSSSNRFEAENQNRAGASVEWQVIGRDSTGGIQLQIIPTFDL